MAYRHIDLFHFITCYAMTPEYKNLRKVLFIFPPLVSKLIFVQFVPAKLFI